MDDAMEIVIQEFLNESYEGLEDLQDDLANLGSCSADPEAISRVYRVIHTIKGTGSFLMYSRLEQLTRAGEGVLARLRDGKLRLEPEIAGHLLRMVATVRTMLGSIERNRQEGEHSYRELAGVLAGYLAE